MAKPVHSLLVVEDDPLFTRALRLQLTGPSTTAGRAEPAFCLSFCAHTALALQHLRTRQPDLILLDIHLGGHEEGLAALPKLIAAAPDVPIVVHSVLSDHATVVRAMRQGAHDYIPKHMGIKTLGQQLGLIIAHHRSALAARRAPAATADADVGGTARPMLGSSAPMVALQGAIARAQRSQGSVIVHGEPGVGKELVARALARPGAPFVSVDASTLEGSMATGLLFGHERGAFTGADAARAGLFEQAHGGVMYFDEIANMSLDVQAKLLRVLQEREVVRLGSTQRRALSFRVVCATHSDLAARCRAGRFRYDLLTRLQVFTLTVPPLRERLGDLETLFYAFVARHSDGAPPPLTAAIWEALRGHSWPGNVRELEHAAQYALAACEGAPLGPQHLPASVTAASASAAGPRPELRAGEADLDRAEARRAPAPAPGALAGVESLVPEPSAAPLRGFGPAYLANGSAGQPGRQDAAQAAAWRAPTPIPAPTSTPSPSAAPGALGAPLGGFYARVRAFERDTLERAYADSHGNISAMARRLEMDRSSLYAKLRAYAIHTPRPS